MRKRNFHRTPRVLAACFFAIIAIFFSAKGGAQSGASTRGFPVLAQRKNIAAPKENALALPEGNVAVAKRAGRELKIDLDGDKKIERVTIDTRRAQTIEIWRDGKFIARGAARSWNAWKMTTGDVDGDGFREIILGVNKPTRSLPFKHNCLFVLGFDGKRIYRKWLGSSLSKPFDDFLLFDLDGDGRDELISLETLPNARRCIAVYSWSGFGFSMDFQRGNWKTARLVSASRLRVLALVDGRKIEIKTPR